MLHLFSSTRQLAKHLSKATAFFLVLLLNGCYSEVKIALKMNHPTSEMGSGIPVYVIVDDERASDSDTYTHQEVTQLLKAEIITGLESRDFIGSSIGKNQNTRVLYSKLRYLKFSGDNLDYFSSERPDFFPDEGKAIVGTRGHVEARLVIQARKQDQEYYNTYIIDQDLYVDSHISEFYGQGIVLLLEKLFDDEALLKFLAD